MLNFDWIALLIVLHMHCIAQIKGKLELCNQIDLHSGMVIHWVDLNDLILELKSPCFISPSVGEYGIIVIHRDNITQGVKTDLSGSLQGRLTPSVLKL
jgi:hypothetical protein